MYPRFLPHLKQRKVIRVEYFAFLFDFAICDFLAMLELLNERSEFSRSYTLLNAALRQFRQRRNYLTG